MRIDPSGYKDMNFEVGAIGGGMSYTGSPELEAQVGELVSTFITDDFETIISGEATLKQKAIAAASMTPLGRVAKVTKVIKGTGQVHHVLSNKIMRSLNNHPTLKGKFNREDPMFKYHAKDLESHKGYQKWHREYDAKVGNWLENNPRATEQQFRKYLNDLHQQPWLKDRIPNVNIK